MDQVLYFVPGINGLRREDVEAAGLGKLLRVGANAGEVVRSPTGKPGAVLHNGDGKGLGYFPDRQDWLEGPGGRFWVGVEGKPPPESLRRPKMLGGHPVVLEDGQAWTVPVARVFGLGSTIPERLSLGPNGEMVRAGLPRFVEFSAAAARLEALYFGEALEAAGEVREEPPPAGVSEREAYDISGLALGLNYYLDAYVAGAIGLLTSENVLEVLGAIIDLPTMRLVAQARRDAEGKAEGAVSPGGPSSGDGSPA